MTQLNKKFEIINKNKFNIVIVQLEYEGHYLTGYIKYILRYFKSFDANIYLILSDEVKIKGLGALNILKKEKVKFKIIYVKDYKIRKKNFINLIYRQFYNYIVVQRALNCLIKINKIKIDELIFTSLENFILPICFFKIPIKNTFFYGIFLGAKFHLSDFNIQQYQKFKIFYKFFFIYFINLKQLSNIITNDHLLFKYIKKKYSYLKSKIVFLHDPKEFNFRYSKINSRKNLKIKKNDFCILIYGALINSKGILELLKIFEERKLKQNIKVIIAGKLMYELDNLLIKKTLHKYTKLNKVYFFENWQDEKKEAQLFFASDIVWMGYKNYSSPSGVLYQAAASKKPLIVSDNGIINKTTLKFKLGFAVDINNPESIIKAIYKLMNKKIYINIQNNQSKFYNMVKPAKWINGFSKARKLFFF